MKKWLLLAVIGLLAACSKSAVEELTTPTGSDAPIFYASVEGADADSRTYLDSQGYMRWTNDDRITIFFGDNYNREFAFTGKTGATSGGFTQKSVDDPFFTAVQLPANYALYPHAAATVLEPAGFFECTLPATQNYAEGSFGLNANTMAAVTESVDDRFLKFKNVCGYLKLNLYGANVTVKQITLQGNNDEPLAGAAVVTPTYGGEPTLTWATSGTTKTLTLDCGAGVKIGQTEEDATAFYLVVPPTTFEKGFTITLTDTADNNFTKSTSNEQIITRNVTKNMPAFEFVTTTVDPTSPVPSNQIWYTSHDGTKIETTAFDATITSHNYVDGMGVITFASDVTQVKADAYKSKTKLATISLPASVTTLGNNAFRDCTRMTTISAPGVTSVGQYAFYNCAKLTDISFPQLKTINSYAFQKCTGLTQVDLRSVETMNSYAFDGCTKLTSVALAKLKGSLGSEAFSDCTALKTIDLPEGVTTIGAYAFYRCTSLASITIPEGVTTIGERAFYDCTSLASITIPEGVTTIENYAFNNCTSLKQVYITDITAWCQISFTYYESNPMSYGADLYLNNVKVEHLVIPEGVTTIRYCAFKGCTSLASITIPESLTTIASCAFYDCTSLASITIPEGVTTIGNAAFKNCTSLASITIPEGVTTIEPSTFENCTSLASITLPEGVTTIGYNAFYGCTSLASITIPEGVTTIGSSAFRYCTSLASITIPEGVTTIEKSAFYDCRSLASITIPEGLTTIGNYAFHGCTSLASITIPEGVTAIGEDAFYGCTSLKSVYCKPTTPPSGGSDMFYNNASGRKIYVPASDDDSIIMAYKAASYWSSYKSYMEEYQF
ncbi:MAG: leucine-rich repeat domain-containing protein [Alistipes sp.]|nr:leucine-rich repeat domain-containing protein [Alistipes sp.]